ncbi:hypothetical protein D3C73_1446260 [compost metagenome]
MLHLLGGLALCRHFALHGLDLALAALQPGCAKHYATGCAAKPQPAAQLAWA